MSESDLVKQMKAEEKLYSADLSKQLTLILNNGATRKAAAEIAKSTAPWPYPPTAEMLRFYDTTVANAWSKLSSGYKHVDVELEVVADAKKAPIVKATASYKGEFKGGESYLLKPGDSIVSVAKAKYGYDSYASVLWDENEDILGKQCKVLPAGFGIRIPRIWVAEWKAPPRQTLASGTSSKAVKIMYPTVEFKFESKSEQTFNIDCGAFILQIKTEVSGSLKAQKKGTIDGTFNLREYTLDVSKNLGPLTGSYSYNLKEGKGTADITLSNSEIKGIGMTTKISIKEGGLKISFGTKKVSYTYKDYTFEGSATFSATGKILPKPSASAPSTSRSPSKAINWNLVVAIVVVGAIVVVAGVAIAGSGGTATPFVAAGAAAAVTLVMAGKSAPSY